MDEVVGKNARQSISVQVSAFYQSVVSRFEDQAGPSGLHVTYDRKNKRFRIPVLTWKWIIAVLFMIGRYPGSVFFGIFTSTSPRVELAPVKSPKRVDPQALHKVHWDEPRSTATLRCGRAVRQFDGIDSGRYPIRFEKGAFWVDFSARSAGDIRQSVEPQADVISNQFDHRSAPLARFLRYVNANGFWVALDSKQKLIRFPPKAWRFMKSHACNIAALEVRYVAGEDESLRLFPADLSRSRSVRAHQSLVYAENGDGSVHHVRIGRCVRGVNLKPYIKHCRIEFNNELGCFQVALKKG
jgi:hypothetical protein